MELSLTLKNMKELKFTPGPWRSDGSTIFYDDGHETYCIVAESRDFLHEEVSEANAILISKAPEMYSALLKACDALGDAKVNLESSTTESKMACQNLIEQALSEINKVLES